MYQKPSLRYCEEYLTNGDVIIFKDKTIKFVDEYNQDTHHIKFYDEDNSIDFWSIYDDIEGIVFSNINGATSMLHFATTVRIAILFIQKKSKYKAYLETIHAYITGDEYHYIYEYCYDCDAFGRYPSSEIEDVQNAIDFLIKVGYVKPKTSRRGKTYYAVRNDLKRWRIMSMSEKADYIWERMKQMKAHPVNMMECVGLKRREKAYEYLKNNPQAKLEDFLKEMEIPNRAKVTK